MFEKYLFQAENIKSFSEILKNVVVENNQLVYNDGVTNLFLYTEGKLGGSPELEHLLKHMTHTTKDNAIDPDLKQIQAIVDTIKSDRKVGERYMSMEKIIESAKYHAFISGKNEGHNEGRNEALEESIKAIIELLKDDNNTIEMIKSKLLAKFDISETATDEYLKKYYN